MPVITTGSQPTDLVALGLEQREERRQGSQQESTFPCPSDGGCRPGQGSTLKSPCLRSTAHPPSVKTACKVLGLSARHPAYYLCSPFLQQFCKIKFVILSLTVEGSSIISSVSHSKLHGKIQSLGHRTPMSVPMVIHLHLLTVLLVKSSSPSPPHPSALLF